MPLKHTLDDAAYKTRLASTRSSDHQGVAPADQSLDVEMDGDVRCMRGRSEPNRTMRFFGHGCSERGIHGIEGERFVEYLRLVVDRLLSIPTTSQFPEPTEPHSFLFVATASRQALADGLVRADAASIDALPGASFPARFGAGADQ